MRKGKRWWQPQNPVIDLVLVIGYVLFIVFAHEWFVQLSVQVMNSLSLNIYNKLVATLGAMGMLAVLSLIIWAIRSKTVVQTSGIVFVALCSLGLLTHFFGFTEMNIEFIHAMEFGLLATLIFPLVGRYGAAVAYAFPVMVFDEWYQYQVLFDYVEYFDFNDLLLDLLGAGLFLSVLKTFDSRTRKPRKLHHRPELYFILLLALTTVILLLTGVVVPYPECAESNTWLVLNDVKEPYGFWRVHPLIGSTYHILEPIPGMVTVFAICLIYLAMDPIRSAK